MDKGKFIVFEGIDGCGKGEQIGLTAKYLFNKEKGRDVILTREPWNSYYGEKMKEILQQDKDPIEKGEECLNLYVNDRLEHTQKIDSWVKEGKIVISDRYYYSNLAYQGAQGVDIEKIIKSNQHFPIPDLALWIDIPTRTALERISNGRDNKEKFEDKKFLSKVSLNYFYMPKVLESLNDLRNLNELYKTNYKETLTRIDGNDTKENVFKQVKTELEKIL
jgi:dTMP kinase